MNYKIKYMPFICNHKHGFLRCNKQCKECEEYCKSGITSAIENPTKADIAGMEPGKIYFIRYGQTTIVGQYKSDDACNLYFFALIHNWQGFESFRIKGAYSVKQGIDHIRRASDPEKQVLLRLMIQHECV